MGLLSNIFGLGKPTKSAQSALDDMVHDTLDGLIKHSQLSLNFKVDIDDDKKIRVELEGSDTDSLTDNGGQLLDSIQFFMKRVLQHQFPDDKIDIFFDSEGFREKKDQNLIELADRLLGICLEKNKSVYVRALPPKDRKIIHQHLAKDERVKSKSIGDGLFKKIKVYPVNLKANNKRKNNSEGQNHASDKD